MNESTDLIHGKIWKAILWFSIPMLVGNLFQQLYNTVDSYVVGNFVSSGALAAVGQSTPIINTLVGFGSLTVASIFPLTKSLKTLIISMLLSFFIVKYAKINVGLCRNM